MLNGLSFVTEVLFIFQPGLLYYLNIGYFIAKVFDGYCNIEQNTDQGVTQVHRYKGTEEQQILTRMLHRVCKI